MNIITLSYDRSAFHVFFFLLLINYFDNVMTKLIANNRTDALKNKILSLERFKTITFIYFF